MNEHKTQKQILDYLELNGFVVTRINSGMTQGGSYIKFYTIWNNKSGSGFPDVVAFKGKRFLLLEIKADKGKLRDSQKDFIEIANSKGVVVYVVSALDQVIEIIQRERF